MADKAYGVSYVTIDVKKVAETGVSVHVATPKLELELRKDCPFG